MIKGNVYILEGHKMALPSNTANGSQGKIDVIHRYLVLQLYLASGDQFSMELSLRDKGNVIFPLYFYYIFRIGGGLCSLTVRRTS